MSPMRDDVPQGPGSSRLSRRTLLRRLLGAAGASLAIGSQAPTGPAVLAAHPRVNPGVRAQAGGGTCILLATDFAEIRAKIAAPGWALDAFNALKRSAD